MSDAGGNILEWLDGKTFEELQAVEHEGRLYFPDTIKSRTAKGSLNERKVAIRVPRQTERAAARAEARAWLKKVGLDEEKDAVHFDAYETICLVARAVREPEAPYAQHLAYEDLGATVDVKSIVDLWDRVNFYERLSNPRVGELDDETFKRVILAIRRKGNLSPLVAIDAAMLDAFLLRTASELSNFLMPNASSPLQATSTPD